MQLFTEKKVLKLHQIKEAYNIQAQGRQVRMMLFSAPTARKKYKAKSNQGSTYHPNTKQSREDDVFLCNYCHKK